LGKVSMSYSLTSGASKEVADYSLKLVVKGARQILNVKDPVTCQKNVLALSMDQPVVRSNYNIANVPDSNYFNLKHKK